LPQSPSKQSDKISNQIPYVDEVFKDKRSGSISIPVHKDEDLS